jgi:hypothetical protein
VRLDAEIGNIDADGSLGEVLRSGSVGAARPFVTIQSAAFADGGNGRLALNLAGQLLVPGPQVSSVLEQFRNHR